MVVGGTCVVLKGIAMESGVMGEDTVKSWKENRNHIQRREKVVGLVCTDLGGEMMAALDLVAALTRQCVLPQNWLTTSPKRIYGARHATGVHSPAISRQIVVRESICSSALAPPFGLLTTTQGKLAVTQDHLSDHTGTWIALVKLILYSFELAMKSDLQSLLSAFCTPMVHKSCSRTRTLTEPTHLVYRG